MKQNKNLVSVHLLAFNGQKYIQACLNSVLNQTYPQIEILVTDNNSSDKTVDYLKKIQAKHKLKIVYNKKNLGFAKGQNQGIERAQGEYILCLNQDVVLDKNFISNALKAFKKYPEAAAVQGKLLRWSGGMNFYNDFADYNISYIIDTKGLAVFKNGRIINREQGQIDNKREKKIKEIFGADGAAPIYRKQALEQVKIILNGRTEYFDEDFFAYKEDVDLAWRFRLYGWRSYYQPSALAWHDRTAGESAATGYWQVIKERRKISKFSKYLAFKNQRLMQLKNELPGHFAKRLPKLIFKEVGSWLYILIFEAYTFKAVKDLIKQAPNAWRKRKIIMANKKVGSKQIEKWFS